MLIIIFVVILILGLIIAGTCYGHLVKTYKKYKTMEIFENITAIDFLANMIQEHGLQTKIALTEGFLTDAYLIKKDIIALSQDVAVGKNIADISIASHELGHALQNKDSSAYMIIDSLLRVLNGLASFVLPLALLTAFVLIFIPSVSYLAPSIFYVGVGSWIVTLIFKIFTIPLELNASKRAYKVMKETEIFTKEELKGTKKVLNAAALTYVGAIFVKLYKFLHTIKKSFRRD